MGLELSAEAAGTGWGVCCKRQRDRRSWALQVRGPQLCWLLGKPESVASPLWVDGGQVVQAAVPFPDVTEPQGCLQGVSSGEV